MHYYNIEVISLTPEEWNTNFRVKTWVTNSDFSFNNCYELVAIICSMVWLRNYEFKVPGWRRYLIIIFVIIIDEKLNVWKYNNIMILYSVIYKTVTFSRYFPRLFYNVPIIKLYAHVHNVFRREIITSYGGETWFKIFKTRPAHSLAYI